MVLEKSLNSRRMNWDKCMFDVIVIVAFFLSVVVVFLGMLLRKYEHAVGTIAAQKMLHCSRIPLSYRQIYFIWDVGIVMLLLTALYLLRHGYFGT